MKTFIKILKRIIIKYLFRPQAPLYSQIDSHKWSSKMEMQHTLSGGSTVEPHPHFFR